MRSEETRALSSDRAGVAGGSKIKEIREVTGASVQVASEMLPNSTERAVTISGGSEAITQCIYNICNIMAEVSQEGREWGEREG